jgi:ABC-2 type transport system permease protein
MRPWHNIFWLGTKELRSVLTDIVMVGFILFSFTFQVYQRANAVGETVNRASVAIVDEDRSELSGRLQTALYPPYFKTPVEIQAAEIQPAMDASRYMFVLTIPPDFEADIRRGRKPELSLDIDATAVTQAGLGAGYIQTIVTSEVNRFAARSDTTAELPVELVVRRAFNPNGTASWFTSIVALLDQLSMLTIVLVGAALLREREHGTIEHLLVMPLTPFQIAMAKVWANALIILVVFTGAVAFVVQDLLSVPIAGSMWLLLAGTTIYLFAAAAIGMFLGTIARSMAQFALLMLMTIIPIIMLSGGISPIESQPPLVQPFTWLLPSRHYMAFAQAVIFRGAGFDIVWPQFAIVTGLGLTFFSASLALFRRSISTGK